MITQKKIITTIATIVTLATIVTSLQQQIYAQQQPQLEKSIPPTTAAKNDTNDDDRAPVFTFSGKVTIPITTSEQIIIDLPISKDSNIQIVPIK